MAGIPNVALPIARLIAVEVVEWRLATLRHRPMVAVMGVIAVVYVSVKAVMAVEPGTSPNENATDKPVRPIVAIGSAVIRRIVEVPIGAAGFNADTHCYLSWPKRCTAEQSNRQGW
jgi:hypothetical protein